jgi:ABC-type Fe3+ transport system substrate-binding protein
MTTRTCLATRALLGRVVLLGLLGLVLCAPAALAQTVDLDALYERAAAEGEVSAYLQGPPQVYAGFVDAFQAKYPKVKVRITSGRYDLMPKIDAQIAAGVLDADLAILQTTQDYVRWKRQGALQRFTPPDFDLIPAGLKDPDAQFLPVFLVMIGLAYNPAQVRDAEVPRTIPDFLKAAFKGKIVSTYPHDDDLTLYSNTLIVEKYGWGMIEKLLAQDMKFVRSHVLVAQETAKGERPVTFDQISQFNKVSFVAPDDLPMPVYPITSGIFAKAPHPNAAKLFLAFAISREQQQRTAASGAIPVRGDVGPASGLKPLSSYRTADGYIDFISNEARTKELRQKFEGYIGPPQGAYISTSPSSPPK